MLRSFHYAAFAPLIQRRIAGEFQDFEHWAKLWTYYISKIFLHSYLEYISPLALVPEDKLKIERLLRLYLLEKAVYEIGYEINNRPEWLSIPLNGILYEIGAIDHDRKEV